MLYYTLKRGFQCLLSPRLYKVYRDGPIDELYKPNKAEECGNVAISMVYFFRSIAFYLSPFIGLYLCKRGFVSFEETVALAKLFGGLSCFVAVAVLVRAYGRATNPQYQMFLAVLNRPKNETYLPNLQRFDFDFTAWPTSYVVPYNSENSCSDRSRPFVCKENAHLPLYKKCIVKCLAYVAIHTFALRLIYPGSLQLISNMMWKSLVAGRAALVEENNGQRVKIAASDGNTIDTMFLDFRGRPHPNGQTLIVCSEGNTGFYEIGIMFTPMKAGYSVLGWNHPGFAGSTGLPYLRQEHCAIDAVMQYAINSLKFHPDQIVMFGWSIGGYSAAWAASNYHTKALILDASFDDLIALARNQMPASWGTLVREVVRSHMDLDVAEMCKNFRGPIHFIRRTDDEVICLTPGSIASNRGNHLLLKIISHRHADEVNIQLEALIRFTMMPEDRRPKINDPELDPSMQNMLRHILRYSSDFKSSHCTALPTERFEGILSYVLETQTYLEE